MTPKMTPKKLNLEKTDTGYARDLGEGAVLHLYRLGGYGRAGRTVGWERRWSWKITQGEQHLADGDESGTIVEAVGDARYTARQRRVLPDTCSFLTEAFPC